MIKSVHLQLLTLVLSSLANAQISFPSSNTGSEQNAELKLQQILDEYGGSRGTGCDCIKIQACQWAAEALDVSRALPKTSSDRNGLVSLLKNRSCGRGQNIRCCESQTSAVDHSNDQEDTTAFGVTGNRRLNHNNSSRGDWIPKDSCGSRLGNFFVLGGVDTFIGEMPFMALLAYRSEEVGLGVKGQFSYLCGGSLINKYYVLTAAHCLDNLTPDHVVIGDHSLRTDPDCSNGDCTQRAQNIPIAGIKIHKNYNKNSFQKGFDIALIRLKTPAKMSIDDLNSLVGPVCLPIEENCKHVLPKGACSSPPSVFTPQRQGRLSKRVVRPDIQLMRVVGWGSTSNNGVVQSAVPQKLDIPVRTPNFCSNLNPDHNEDIQICAGGEKDEDSCRGDSGGPLLLGAGRTRGEPWVQMGIVSFGPSNCGRDGFAGTYTYIPAFMNWIVDNIFP